MACFWFCLLEQYLSWSHSKYLIKCFSIIQLRYAIQNFLPSIVFVLMPLIENPTWWLIVQWIWFWSKDSNPEYPLQQSVIMVDPGFTYCLITISSVSAFLWGTTARNTFLAWVFSTPPKTQTPSTRCPLWYFLLPNFDSSIWTSMLWPFSSYPPI